ncbi:hypothetical protein AAFC00_002082 [Neodothiora populina]|uniref:Zincin n=1 Tax=Neodothiora populina TaxID=2781224 RepID=A0ABR3PG74_9PEZI
MRISSSVRANTLNLSVWTTLLLATSLVSASSVIRNPIRALSTVRNSTIHTFNNHVTALSSFDLTFLLHDDIEIKLALEPNHDILPDSGITVTHLGPDGEIVRTEEIDRLSHKVYRGTAWVRRESSGKGESEWMNAGWARASVLRDGVDPLFEGAFALYHNNHHIMTSHNYERTRHPLDPEIESRDDDFMLVWRDSDIIRDEDMTVGHTELRRDLLDQGSLACSSDVLDFNTNPDHPVFAGVLKRTDLHWGSMSFSSLFAKRQLDSSTGGNGAGVSLVSTIGQTNGCPSTRKVALVGVATDCTYTASFNSTESVRQNVINQMNTASNLYERTFNISLGLQNLTVSDASCPGTPPSTTPWNQPCSDSVDIQDRLNMFSAWRGTLQDNNSHWTLLSTCNTGSAVGLAWLGQACVTGSISTNSSTTGNGQSGSGRETVTGANVVIRTQGASEWQVIAHETGHTFGAVHDCTSDVCTTQSTTVSSSQCCPYSANTCDAGERYIMNPSTSSGITDFSPCSIGNICSALGRNSVHSNCLSDNKGVTTISGQQCGNGIVEEGEDCDCGGAEGCGDNQCCEPTTCKFKETAVCDDSNEGCCNSCQFANNGTICRASTGDCDPAETCTGSSAFCPADVNAPDGNSCGSGGGLTCASGQCTSRDLQCKTIMGSYTTGNDTYACDHSSCSLSCASPEFGYGVCYGLQQNFLDGTSCSGGGKCQNGQCKGTSVGGEVRSWIDDHKALVIGLAAGIGGFIVLALLSCLISCCRRRRRIAAPPRAMMAAPPPGGWGGWGPGGPPGGGARGVPPPPPPPYMQQQQQQSGGVWYPPPQAPPPSYGGVRYG